MVIPEAVINEMEEAIRRGMIEFIHPGLVIALIREVRKLRQQVEDMDCAHARTRFALDARTDEYERTDSALRDALLQVKALQRDKDA